MGKLYMPEEEIKDGFSLLQNSSREASCLTSITFEFFPWLTSWLRTFLSSVACETLRCNYLSFHILLSIVKMKFSNFLRIAVFHTFLKRSHPLSNCWQVLQRNTDRRIITVYRGIKSHKYNLCCSEAQQEENSLLLNFHDTMVDSRYLVFIFYKFQINKMLRFRIQERN